MNDLIPIAGIRNLASQRRPDLSDKLDWEGWVRRVRIDISVNAGCPCTWVPKTLDISTGI